MSVGLIISVTRIARGIQQGELAARIGCTQSYLSQVEKGRKEPGTQFIDRAFKLLEVPFSSEELSAYGTQTDGEQEDTQKLLFALKAATDSISKSRQTLGSSLVESGVTFLGVKRVGHLATLLGTTEEVLWRVCEELDSIDEDPNQSDCEHYRMWTKDKSSGGTREICASQGLLKQWQKCIARQIGRYPFNSVSYGSIRGRGPRANAKCHAGKSHLWKFDIKDFFGSTGRGLVYLSFRKRLDCSHKVAQLLARLTTLHDSLPQGAPTSPVVAALCVDNSIAKRLQTLSQRLGATITLYVDDITVSSNHVLPRVESEISRIVTKAGYSLKPEKTELPSAGADKIVTGFSITGGVDCLSTSRLRVKATIRDLQSRVACGDELRGKLLLSIEGVIGSISQGNRGAGQHLRTLFGRALSIGNPIWVRCGNSMEGERVAGLLRRFGLNTADSRLLIHGRR